jgi:hypothetical protein
MSNFHFYRKVDFMKFSKEYKIEPVKEFLKNSFIDSNLDEIERHKKEELLDEQIEICTNLINRDFIYLPYSFSLVSSYPNFKSLEKCLDCIFSLINNKDTESNLITDLLNNLIYEIPSPLNNQVYTFFLPNSTNPVQIYNFIFNDIPKINKSPTILFKYLSIENIILIHHLLLLERKILFVTENCEFDIMSKISEVFLELLYPIKWVDIYIPIISVDMLKYLQTFMPFVIGIDISMMNLAKENLENEIYLVHLHKNTVELFQDNKFEIIKNTDLHPKLPIENFNFLFAELKIIKENFEENKKKKRKDWDNYFETKQNINIEIKETFTKSMAILFEDYKKFTIIIDSVPNFNEINFIESRNISNKPFYTEFLQTQSFRQFLQSSCLNSEAEYLKFFYNTCLTFRQVFGLTKRSSVAINRNHLDIKRFSHEYTRDQIQNFFSISPIKQSKIFSESPVLLKTLTNPISAIREKNQQIKTPSGRDNKINFNVDLNILQESLEKVLWPFFISCNSKNLSLEMIEEFIHNTFTYYKSYSNRVINGDEIDIKNLKLKIEENLQTKILKKYDFNRSRDLNNFNKSSLYNNSPSIVRNSILNEEILSPENNSPIINQMLEIKKRNTLIKSPDIKGPITNQNNCKI